MTLETIYRIMMGLLGVSGVLLIAIFLQKWVIRRQLKQASRVESFFIRHYINAEPIPHIRSKRLLFQSYRTYYEQLVLDETTKAHICDDFEAFGLIDRMCRQVHSPIRFYRKRAASYLGYFELPKTKFALITQLKKERIPNVKLYLINALKNQMDQMTLVTLIDSLIGSKQFYQSRVIQIIKNYLLKNFIHTPDIFNREEPEIKELFVDLSESLFREDFHVALKEELVKIEDHLAKRTLHPTYSKMVESRVKRLYYRILTVLSTIYGDDFETEKYLHHPDVEVIKIAMGALSKPRTLEQVRRLILLANGSDIDNHIVGIIQNMVEVNNDLYTALQDGFLKTTDDIQNQIIANVLASKMEYLALKYKNTQDPTLRQIIVKILKYGYDASLIQFLNQASDKKLQKDLCKILADQVETNPSLKANLLIYLDEKLLPLVSLEKPEIINENKKTPELEAAKIRWLRFLLIVTILFFPLLFVALNLSFLFTNSLSDIWKEFVVFVNESLVVYYMSVNGLYLLLALLSAYGAYQQRRLWSIKSRSLLYESKILPSISILAPAYNEELTIIDSIKSLLNLKYPHYEVVVVNDGSKDQTLKKVIDYFHLERKNVPMNVLIPTKAIKAVYRNKNLPNLTLIDKANGGKADALNVGINFAKNEFVCGIDADSLLEPDALLKLMSSALDHDEITLALGGNIHPANGSTIVDGIVEKEGLSNDALAALQTIEYLRAFSLGRVGWSKMRSLLIISGAFGLFEKRMLAEVGGYLTTSTFKKDTVGEDMELVVRITKKALKRRLNYRIDYIHNAICYTEVPEDFKSFRRQRNRWQRGLIDILSYHRDMIFNPRFHQIGLISTPYFFIFELIGPLIEVQGLLFLIVSGFMGLLNASIVLLLLIASVMLGMVISLGSLLVAERDHEYLSVKDTLILTLIAIFENFGWRQFVSVYRIVGFFASMRREKGWGFVQRTGFKTSK